MQLAVIGAGWAGLAAAVAATDAGHKVTVFEAARVLGGRARTLEVQLPDGQAAMLDNGQHIMIGAYLQTLRMMEKVGIDPAAVLLRLPLVLRFPDGGGLQLPLWPAPLDAVAGIVTARGWTWGDRFSLLRASMRWQLARFACAPQASVADACRGLTQRVMAELVEPLCVSALNTPAARASGQVFLRVIRDALFGKGHAGFGGSNLLVPRHDLGKLFPEVAQAWLVRHGAQVVTGHRVQKIAREGAGWRVDGRQFDAVLLACPPWEAARLVAASGIAATHWVASVQALDHEAIATVYAMGGPRLPLPIMALRSDAANPAQFVFDRSQLGGPDGLLAFVVSASQGDRETLERQVLQQAQSLGWTVQPAQTVVEKRATFACVPGLQRPSIAIAPGLLACGDYVDGPYPATIEGAIRTALQAVAAVT